LKLRATQKKQFCLSKTASPPSTIDSVVQCKLDIVRFHWTTHVYEFVTKMTKQKTVQIVCSEKRRALKAEQ